MEHIRNIVERVIDDIRKENEHVKNCGECGVEEEVCDLFAVCPLKYGLTEKH